MSLECWLTAENWMKTAPPGLPGEITRQLGILESIPVSKVTIELGHWVKASQIHKWFVNTVQEKVDDCLEHDVSRYQLTLLKRTCLEVIESNHRAPELLPCQMAMFFDGTAPFGNIDYGEQYYEVLNNVVGVINTALSLPEEWDFKYRSSW
jgi:hypothetical protein